MKKQTRAFGALGLLLVLGISAPGARQAETLPHWRVGDVFLGIGTWDTATGQYLVFNADGTPKLVADAQTGTAVPEKLFDAAALTDLDAWGAPEGSYTTGCAVAPDDTLFVTTFWGRKLRRFSSAHPHAAPSIVHDFATNAAGGEDVNGIDAVESLVFDAGGNFYVGIHPSPRRETSADPLNPFTRIYKFPAGYDPTTSAAPTVYDVPNGEAGVDWIDLGPDGKTIYYTSESDRLYWYRPADGTMAAEAGSLRVHEPENPADGIEGRLYAFRALPPNPGETRPSGFIFAHQRGPVRTDADGKVVSWYNTPGAQGSFFALSISPDGKYFWTTNFPNGAGGVGGQLYRYHISHRDPVQGPIATGAPAGAYGLCVKGEYTAAVNTCYVSDRSGRILYDENNQPIVQRDPRTNLPMCQVPEVCGNAGDEDGDGLPDSDDPDCTPAGPPRVTLPDQAHPEYTPVDIDLGPFAVDPDGDPLTFFATGLPDGLLMSTGGRITGTTPVARSREPYAVAVTVVAAAGTPSAQTVVTTFKWSVTGNLPPELSNPGDVRCTVGYACSALQLHVHDEDRDSFIATAPPGSRPWAPGVDCSTAAGCTGLPPGLSLPPDGMIDSGGQIDYSFRILGTPGLVGAGIVPGAAGLFTVEICGIDHTIADDLRPHAPTCETFRLTLVDRSGNRPPDAVDDAASVVGRSPSRIDVLANDADSDAEPLAILTGGFTQPGHGSVTLDPGGGFLYTARAGFSGVDTFTYTISDGLATDVATVRVTVMPARVCYAAKGSPHVIATQDWWYRLDGPLTIRTTLGTAFTDNTYGVNAIGWPGGSAAGNHRFNHLLASDMVQIALYDVSDTRRLEMKLDYLSESPGFPSGYGSLGAAGGDGAMIAGSAAHVLGAESSLARNFNEHGYVLTSDSPATDGRYTANPQYPDWIFEVWYEVTVSAEAFAAAFPFKRPGITLLHASPSKVGSATEPLTVIACPGGVATRNEAPVGAGDTYSVDRNRTLNVHASGGVLVNDHDPEGDDLTAVLAGEVSAGSLTLKRNGSFTYRAPGAPQIVTFTYRLQDASGNLSEPVLVTIRVLR